MNYITKITKRDIVELLKNGMTENTFIDVKAVYAYYGRLEEIDFLNRIYDLQLMESFDGRFWTAEDDIWQHTINNDDYPYGWVFEDDRFELKDGPDDVFLKFICEIFHPEVRVENEEWKLFFDEINRLLNQDGYELYVVKKISGRAVYSWRRYKEEPLLIPFSQRNKEKIKNKEIQVNLSRVLRYQLYQKLNSFNETLVVKDETNLNYTRLISDFVFDDIKQFYKPMNYENNQYVESTSLEKFIGKTSPYSVFDAIEYFNLHVSKKHEYKEKINTIFKLNNVDFIFNEGKICLSSHIDMMIDSSIRIKEIGVEELLIEAEKFYKEKQFDIATEKIWDAFERAKTYYFPTLNKKKSATRIILQLSLENEDMKKVYDEEFRKLTEIGNSFRIRHHEKNKIDISDDIHYEYFYKRCLSLISVILKSI